MNHLNFAWLAFLCSFLHCSVSKIALTKFPGAKHSSTCQYFQRILLDRFEGVIASQEKTLGKFYGRGEILVRGICFF